MRKNARGKIAIIDYETGYYQNENEATRFTNDLSTFNITGNIQALNILLGNSNYCNILTLTCFDFPLSRYSLM